MISFEIFDNIRTNYDSCDPKQAVILESEEIRARLVASFLSEEKEAENEYVKIAIDILENLMRLEPKLYVTLIESVRYADDGGQRTLNHVKRITNELFHEDISFQMVSARLKAARRKLNA